jgi:MFS family permease
VTATSSANRGAHPWYVLGVLTVAYTLSFVDRQILTLLVGPIKRDLGLSDTRISLLQGLSFALFYTVMGLPLGRLADRSNRRRLIVAGITVWSGMTALAGFARTFPQLVLARIGVGVGEAALSPAAYSLIRDYFPTRQLGRAASVYNLGVHFGGALALVIGGAVVGRLGEAGVVTLPLVGTIRSWQAVFFIVGIPGLLVALLVATIHEPERRRAPGAVDASIGDLLAFLRANRRLIGAYLGGFSLLSLLAYGSGAWAPTFLIRTYGWGAAETGAAYGLISLTAGPIGVLAGGAYADWLHARGHRDATVRAGMHSAMVLWPFAVATPLMPTAEAALALGWFVTLLFAFPFGAAAAAIQLIAPAAIRAQLTAVYLFVSTLVGLGLGPVIVALLTDRVFGDPSELRYALLTVAVALPPVAALFLRAGLAPFRALRQEGDQ